MLPEQLSKERKDDVSDTMETSKDLTKVQRTNKCLT